MKKQVPSRSFSPVDAAFLHLERKEIPMHIASVCVFDGPIPFQEFVAGVESKLHLIPRYRQIPVVPSWNLGLPSWEDDLHFDILHHIVPVTLDPPGGDAELQVIAGRIFSQLLDRNKPLWDMHIVDGLKDGRGAIIVRVHHALADGASGAELLKTLFDAIPDASPRTPGPRYRPRRAPVKEASLADGLFGAMNNALGGLLAFEAGLLDFAKAALSSEKQGGVRELIELAPEFAASVERLPFNKPCTGERKFCWTEFGLKDVRTIRDAAGGTVNDVILAVLTRALARYVKLHGQSVVNRFVRIVCPVSLRQGAANDGLGNQISFLPVALPLGTRGPAQTLKAVATRTEAMKRSGAAGLVGLAARWIAAAPPPLQAIFWRTIPDVIFPVPLFNMICTNVIGSPTPLYASGRRMLAAYPQVPTGYDLGVGCAVHSYDGKLFFGLIADTEAAPDVERLRDFLVVSFQELLGSATLRKSRVTGKAKRTRGTQDQKPEETVTPAGAESPKLDQPPPRPTAAHAREAA